LGAGLVISGLLWLLFPPSLSDFQLETLARERLGMILPAEQLPWEGPPLPAAGVPAPQEEQQAMEPLTVTIPGGSSLEEISAILLETGIIADRAAFEAEVQSRGLSTGLKAGTYHLARDLNLEEILTYLTNP